eukprot:UN00920
MGVWCEKRKLRSVVHCCYINLRNSNGKIAWKGCSSSEELSKKK